MAGLYFEEFTEGQVFEHAIGRTVTEMDNVLFSTLTMNPQPLHLDEEFAKKTEFGQRLVNSLFTLGLVIGISVGDTTLGHDDRQSRHERGSLSKAGVSRRHAAGAHDRALEAREPLAARRRHRRIRASGHQPARRNRRDLPPRRADDAPPRRHRSRRVECARFCLSRPTASASSPAGRNRAPTR